MFLIVRARFQLGEQPAGQSQPGHGATFTNAPNTGVVFVTLKPFKDRPGITKDMILADLRGRMFALREAFVFVLEPPSVPGIGTGGGIGRRAGGEDQGERSKRETA